MKIAATWCGGGVDTTVSPPAAWCQRSCDCYHLHLSCPRSTHELFHIWMFGAVRFNRRAHKLSYVWIFGSAARFSVSTFQYICISQLSLLRIFGFSARFNLLWSVFFQVRLPRLLVRRLESDVAGARVARSNASTDC